MHRSKPSRTEKEELLVSIIIPVLNEARAIGETLRAVTGLAGDFEVLIVDGGSSDATADVAQASGATVIRATRGRGSQLAAGAAAARGDVLWFLHADTVPSPDALQHIDAALNDPLVVAGNFRVHFSGNSTAARFLSWLHPKTHGPRLSFGDSAIFVRKQVYEEVGGFASYPLFEDLDLVKRLLRRGRFVRVPARVTTSSRRFEQRNLCKTYLLWGALLLAYQMGMDPGKLAKWYKAVR